MDHKGGSWLVYDQNALMFFLNGAQDYHVPQSHYRKSRGLILIELFTGAPIQSLWDNIDLKDVEPFAIIYFHKLENFIEYMWDGENKFAKEYDPLENQL